MSVDFEGAQKNAKQNAPETPGFPSGDNDSTTTDDRSPEQQNQDAELADRLSSLIEDANRRVVPLCKMIRKVRFPSSSSSSITAFLQTYSFL